MAITVSHYNQMRSAAREPVSKKPIRSKKAVVTIGGKKFFARSAWESNIGAYLQYLRDRNEIADWAHEPDEFWFEGVKRGTRSYLPDFKVFRIDGTIYYIEVKGWMDTVSKTKLRRMKKYHPNVEVQLIDSKKYAKIKKSAHLIKAWGLL